MIFFQFINKKILWAALCAALLVLTVNIKAFAAELPEYVAVLPITGDATPEDLKELRVTFFNHIGSKNYRDMELADVDSKIFLLEQKTGKKWTELEHKEIAEALGVDGLIFLKVGGVERLYTGVYGSLSVKLEVTFEESKTGRVIWKKISEEVRRSGSVPLSPWSAISTVVSSALVLRDSVKIEIFDKLCRQIAKAIPEPEKLGDVKSPTIFSVVTNLLDSPFKAHEELLISLKGDEKLRAYFSVVGQTDAVELFEVKPGEYLGKYVIPENTNFAGQLVEVFLANGTTKKVSKYQVPYLVTVDTIPPGEPKDLADGITQKGVKISWVKPEDADVKDFVLEKAVSGTTEFKQLAATELNEYIDGDVSFGQKIFYKVYARDKADNLSKPVEISRVVVTPGPSEVSGELKEDTVFYAYSSPFIINRELVVPKGIKLTIEPGAVIRFEDGASLRVEGRIDAVGSEDAKVTFKGRNYVITIAETGSKNAVFKNVFLRGGNKFQVFNSDVEFSGCKVEGFKQGLISDHDSNLSITDCVFSDNATAILGKSGSVACDNVELSNNICGLALTGDAKGSLGTIRLNQNETDIQSDGSLLVQKIVTSQSESYELIKAIKGPVEILSVSPYMKSLRMLKEDSAGELLVKLADSLTSDDYEESKRLMDILKEIYPSKYEKAKAVYGYLQYKNGMHLEGKDTIVTSKAEYAEAILAALGLSADAEKAVRVDLEVVKLPVFGTGEGLGKIAATKAAKQSLKEYTEGLTGKLPRNKMFMVKSEIVENSDTFTSGSYEVGARIKNNIYEGMYIVFIKKSAIIGKLQELGIIGVKKRAVKIGLVSCGDVDFVRPEIAKELNNLMFSVVELPAKGCLYEDYNEDLPKADVGVLLMIKENGDVNKSHFSENMKMINADLGISIHNVTSGVVVLNKNEGSSTLHVNRSDGIRKALMTAFSVMRPAVIEKILELERHAAAEQAKIAAAKAAEDAAAQPAETAAVEPQVEQSEVSANGIILSVVSVEPVYANISDAFYDEPFMNIALENQTDAGIKDAVVSLDVPGFLDEPISFTIDSVPAMDRVRLPIKLKFNSSLKGTVEDMKVDAVLKLVYGTTETELKYPIEIYGNHSINWKNTGAIGTFIDELSPVVSDIATLVNKEVDRLTENYQAKKVLRAILAFEVMTKSGVVYTPEEDEFADIYNEARADKVHYAAEVFQKKAGDADDIFVSYASILRALGMDAAFIVDKTHLVMLAATGVPMELAEKYGIKKERMVIINDNIWLPFDPAKISDGALTAWESGSKDVPSINENAEIIKISEAVESVKQAGLYREKVELPDLSVFEADFDKIKTDLIK